MKKPTRQEEINWQATAFTFYGSFQYYQGLLDKIGKSVGKSAHVCDDGSWSDDILRAKLPQLVRALIKENKRLKKEAKEMSKTSIKTKY